MQRLGILLLVWVLVGDTASAGVYLPLSGSAELSRERAVLLLEGNITTLMLQSSYVGTATELAWLVPVGGAAQEVGFGPADAFSRLHEQSAPQLLRVVEKRRDLGCTTEGVTFVTKTNLDPWTGLAASDVTHSALDGQVSSQIVAWLQGETISDVCADRATSCTTDEDCGGVTVCDVDRGCNSGGGDPSGCCMNQAVFCDDDGDCGGKIECFERMCVGLTPTCSDDTDCGGRRACGPLGFCRYLTAACTRDEDCGGVTEADLCLPRVCSGDTAVTCSETSECEALELGECLLRCPGGETACDDDQDCGPQECLANTCGDGTPCFNDTDCGGIRECTGGTCIDNGADCDVDEDCNNGVTECSGHCSNLRVPCTSDGDCNYECVLGQCQQPAEGLCQVRDCQGDSCEPTCPGGESCTNNEQCINRTEVPCDEDSDCAATDECQTFTIAGSATSVCTNLAPFCSTNAECNVACIESPPGSGDKVCAGSSMPCTDADGDGVDPACSAAVECQHNVCLNLTTTCTADLECGTSCVDDKCGGVGIPCDRDGDCAAIRDCRPRTKPGDSYPLSDEQLAWLNQCVDDGVNIVVTELSGVSSATGSEVLAPLAIRVGGDVPFFPLRQVATSLELELYIIAAERYLPKNYASTELAIDPVFDGNDFDTWYEEQIERNLANAGGPTFLVEYAGLIDGSLVESVLGRAPNVPAQTWFLTKLRTRLSAAEAVDDLELTSTGDTQPFVIRTIGSSTTTQAAVPFGGLGILLVAALVWHRARRRC